MQRRMHLIIIKGRDVRIVGRMLRSMDAILLLAMREFNRGEPLIRQGGNKVFVVIVGLEAMEGEEVRPRGWGFRFTGVDSFKEIVIDDVELRTDMVGPKILN